jgi:acetylglutamate/LysW-gamma-L-alpha-aminoadipate kinase
MIVVKVGGRVLKNSIDNLIQGILNYPGKLVLVHGGGDQVTELTKKMGIEPKFVTSPEGIRSRYTSYEELEVYVMTMSLINKMLVSKLNSKGKDCIGVSGVDGPILIAERKKKIVIIDERGRKRIIEGGYTGKIKEVRKDLIQSLLEKFNVIVMSPIALSLDEGVPLNIDGDQTAFSIASSLKVETLILLTDVEGVIIDNKIVPRLSSQEAKELSKKIGPGMNRKLLMASEAISQGVRRVIISSGLKNDPIRNALELNGTVVE